MMGKKKLKCIQDGPIRGAAIRSSPNKKSAGQIVATLRHPRAYSFAPGSEGKVALGPEIRSDLMLPPASTCMLGRLRAAIIEQPATKSRTAQGFLGCGSARKQHLEYRPMAREVPTTSGKSKSA